MIFRTYNDNDPNACAWLRELIAMEELPDGFIDECSITDLRPQDIGDHAHLFAGIGGWPHVLELVGWPDNRPVWTASLPCQPFSVAGRGRGHEDERHLWPVFYDLVRECRPAIIFGEQVASKAGRAWLAAVQADMEALGYRTGAADLCAAGVGAPHIRQRLYWVAYDHRQRQPQRAECDSGKDRPGQCAPCKDDVVRCGSDGGLPDPERSGRRGRAPDAGRGQEERVVVAGGGESPWSNVVYVPCADGKVRPLEPGLEPLVDELPRELVRGSDQRLAPERTAEARTMRLRGFGNAIAPPLAAVFVRTVMEYLDP